VGDGTVPHLPCPLLALGPGEGCDGDVDAEVSAGGTGQVLSRERLPRTKPGAVRSD